MTNSIELEDTELAEIAVVAIAKAALNMCPKLVVNRDDVLFAPLWVIATIEVVYFTASLFDADSSEAFAKVSGDPSLQAAVSAAYRAKHSAWGLMTMIQSWVTPSA